MLIFSFLYFLLRKKEPRETIPKRDEKVATLHVPTPTTTPEEKKLPLVELPSKTYEPFNNSRAVELLGLSQEEADMFIGELIAQFDAEFSHLEEAVRQKDYKRIETISHSLKGSSTSLGTGGVSDVLIDFNTYVKTGTDMQVIEAHLENLKHYLAGLRRAFG